MARKMGIIVVCLVLLQLAVNFQTTKAAVFDKKIEEKKTEVAPNVTHIKENYQSSNIREAVNILDIQLNNTYTKLEIGLPNPLNSLKTTTSMARANSYEGHRVVGAVNASFFLGTGPANLLAKNNQIINYGILGEKYESPTQKPVAFGITKSGKAIADYYTTNLSFTVNGKTYPIDLINSERSENKNVLYTSAQKTTETNKWGIDIVVSKASKSTKEIYFGDKITGSISSVTQYSQPGNSTIPQDGFVVSVQNKELAMQLSTLPKDTAIEVNLSIEDKWKDAQFILAAGPLLVKDGKVNISMPNDTSFVKSRSDRTAVAVDSTGTRVFLVTVDGRQSGYSNGTSLTDLASYLISKGASAAINLDGGGSTTMAVRQPYTLSPILANRPSDGSERRVSAILQVVNTAPPGKMKMIKLNTFNGEIPKGTSFEVGVSEAYDEYMNPSPVNPDKVKWSVQGAIGEIVGTTFTATAKGSGKIIAEYEGVRAERNIKVIDLGEKPFLLESFDQVSSWSSSEAKAHVSITNSAHWEPARQGASSLKLSYDFTTSEVGTKAAYMIAKTPISILGVPNNIGVWVYGDGSKHWLRGIIVDGKGAKHTIDFTPPGGLNWTGWKYVSADIPENLPLPLKFERIYITQPTASLQNKGTLFFDQLQAIYKDHHEELIYTDVTKASIEWAYASIQNLNDNGLIKGYPNGTFQPANNITRGEAASIIARTLNLTKTKNPSFSDVKSNYYAYDEIAAVSEKGIFLGREPGKFSPEGKLTRAEMAAILKRAYNLTGKSELPFKDISSKHWAYKDIQTMMANHLIAGFTDNTFRPDNQITRAEFVAFLDRVLNK